MKIYVPELVCSKNLHKNTEQNDGKQNKNPKAKLLASASILGLSFSVPAIASDQDRQIDEIIVSSERGDSDPTKMSTGTKALMKIAGNLGDPLSALTSLPGISFGGGDLDEPVVRGSGPEDNLYIIDDMEVGYLFHELSDSVLSQSSVRSFDLKAAAYGAEFGNAMGGVINVALRDPSGDRFRGDVDISMLKSSVQIEGPISDNSAFYIGGRYNTAHWFLTRFEEQNDGTTFKMPKSHDYTARYKWSGDSVAITLTAIGAQDIEENVQNEGVVSDIPLGDKRKKYYHTQGIKFEKFFENGGSLTTVVSHTLSKDNYTYQGNRFENNKRNGYYLRTHYDREFGAHDLTVGLNYSHIKATYDYNTYLTYCDDFHPTCFNSRSTDNTRKDTFKASELYIKDIWSVSDTVRLELGVQGSIDHYLSEEFIEPRVGIYWDASETSEFYARYGRYHQRPEISDILTFVRTQKDQKNERASHYLVGNRWNFTDGWYMQTEAYYKDTYTVEFPNTSVETKVDGESYGAEILIAKQAQETGLYGWLALSYGKSTRKDRISGKKIDFRYNTPFSATAALSYNFGGGWNFGIKYKVQSGDAYTPVNGVTLHPDGYFVFDYGQTNSERLPTYHRLDARLEKRSEYSWATVTYYIDVLNAFGRENLSEREYPWQLVTPTGDGGWRANPDDSGNIPFYGAFGVNIAF